MKLKRTLALVLTLMMLLPCFLTAAFAADDGDWLTHESLVNENGFVCTKETMKSSNGAGYVYQYTFDAQGHLLKAVESNRESDGTRFGNVKTCTYNKAGDLVTEAYSFEGQDGDFEKYLAVYSYDKKGRLTKETLSFQNAEGTETNVRTLTYDAKGNKTKAVVNQRQADGITSRELYTYAYDKQNRVVQKKYRSSSSVDYIHNETTKYVFENGRLAKEILVEVSGIDDNITTYRTTTTHTYDKKGNEIKTSVRVKTSDDVSSSEVTTRTFGKQKRLLTEKTVKKDSFGTSLTISAVNTYDENGFLAKHVKTEKSNDGRNDRLTETYVNDKKGNPVKKTTVETMYGDTTKTVETAAYDKKGRLTDRATTVRYDDGSHYKTKESFVYDKFDNVTRTVVVFANEEGKTKEVYVFSFRKIAK